MGLADRVESRAPLASVVRQVPGRSPNAPSHGLSVLIVQAAHPTVAYVEMLVPDDFRMPAVAEVALLHPARNGWTPADARQFGQQGYRTSGGHDAPAEAPGYPLDETVRNHFFRGLAIAQKQAMRVVAWSWPLLVLDGFARHASRRMLYVDPSGTHRLVPLTPHERPDVPLTDPFARRDRWS